jgi:hypothetical protein
MDLNTDFLTKTINLDKPLIGVYDAPEDAAFKPTVKVKPRGRTCIFEFYKDWMEGKTLQLTSTNYGCGGCSTWIFNNPTRSREDFVDFLANKEGLKDSPMTMLGWIDSMQPYLPEFGNIFIGPLKVGLEQYLKTITFYVNPDQLSVLLTGAQYFHKAGEPAPVTADFGSGCMEILPLVSDNESPKAIIGATDMAMRQHLPENVLAFTVNKPMLEQLCRLDKTSFLGKPFLRRLKKYRGGRL